MNKDGTLKQVFELDERGRHVNPVHSLEKVRAPILVSTRHGQRNKVDLPTPDLLQVMDDSPMTSPVPEERYADVMAQMETYVSEWGMEMMDTQDPSEFGELARFRTGRKDEEYVMELSGLDLVSSESELDNSWRYEG
jgi:hypothetical protein